MTKIAIQGAHGATLHTIGDPVDLHMPTVVSALAHLNRFTGHVGRYSVATHSVLVSRLCPAGLRLSGLLHDVCEAFLGDVAAPLKAVIGPQYAELESVYLDHVDRTYGVQTRHPDVKRADKEALQLEANVFDLPIHVTDVGVGFSSFGADLAHAALRTDNAYYDAELFAREFELLTGAKL